jgi:hypothetical protein
MKAEAKKYDLEATLVSDILIHLPSYLRGKGLCWRVCNEVGVGRTIADVVALDWPREQGIEPRQPLSVSESVVLSLLRRGGPTRIDLLETLCGAGQRGLRKGRLDRLEDWGILRFERGGRVALADAWQTAIRVVALEAKLTRWKTALKQAIAYRTYADEAYVVLPEDRTRPAESKQELFKEAGVGLLKATSSGLVEVISARASEDHDWRREFVVSRLLHHAA